MATTAGERDVVPEREPPELTRRGRQSRAALLDAAAVIFGRDGFLNARIGDIAAEAGLSHGSFYTYFDSKEAIFREIIDALRDDMIRPVERRQASDDPYELVLRTNEHFIEVYKRNAALMATLEQVSTFDPEIARYRADMRKGYVERNARAIRRWQAEGLADPSIDARHAATALGAMVDRLVYIWLVQGEDLDEQLTLETLTRLWIQGLGLKAPDLVRTRSRPEHAASPQGSGAASAGRISTANRTPPGS